MSTQDAGARRAALSDTKRALLEARLRGSAAGARPRETVGRVAGPGPEHPASFAQERMWFAHGLAPESPMYNVPAALLVRADVDVAVLRRALDEVLRRHETLRTVFRREGAELRQVVREPHPWPLEVRDVRPLVGADYAAGVRALVAEEAARPFADLADGPIVRAALLRVSGERSALVVVVHHVAVDGWSIGMVMGELVALYEAFAEGRPSPLAEPEVRYADYAVWQRAQLQGEALERQSAFWRDALAGAPVLELPADRARPPLPSHRGRAHRFALDAREAAGLRALCAAERATLNMGMTAALAALLARYAGQDEVVIGSVTAGRGVPELEPVVGMFVNTVALRVPVDGDDGFRALLRRARAAVLDADRNQDLPFERVVELLGAPRDPSRHPLFQVMYSHNALPGGGDASFATRLDPQPLPGDDVGAVESGGAQFDLAFTSFEMEGGRVGVLVEYATDLFDAPAIERMGAHLRALVAGAGADPDVPVRALEMMDADERAAVLAASAGPALEGMQDGPVHAWIRAHARRAPDAPALDAEDARLTRGELDAWAARIAAELRARGIGRGDVVGLHLDRTASTVAAMLGILHAGAAYVPVSPTLPVERIRFMLEDTAARIVLTDAGNLDPLPEGGPPAIPCPPPPAPGDALDFASAEVDGRDRAYLIYTSGSTGRPKAVEVEHASLRGYVHATRATQGITADDVVFAQSTAAFDMSVLDIFVTLAAGGRTVMAPAELAADGPGMARMMDGAGATFMQATPATWRILVQSGWAGRRGMRVLAAGEALSPDLAAELARRADVVWNAYGPTEATVCCTAFVYRGADEGTVPIGPPLAGARTYVLDAALRPCGFGVPGELFIGGGGVARGYGGRPALTAERFVPDPFSGVPGARMYRTGDRVRWGADGAVRFMGRLDGQIKLRGYRIELGEVEAELLRHPGVLAAAAVLREDAPGDPRLVAYVVGRGGEAPGGAELRALLRERLPEYMLPSAFVPLDGLPRTPSGKLDRRALPAPDAGADAPAEVVAPRNAVEDMLAEIWMEVLRRDRIGVTENFFAVGGHSLLATQVLVRIQDTFEVQIPIRTFFADPTIAALAVAVEAAGSPVLAAMMDELAGLSPEEIEALLAGESA